MATNVGVGNKSQSVHFSKMHGLGNDFVMLPDTELAQLVAAACASGQCQATDIDGAWLERFCSKLASHLCNRHFGIGGDGLIVAIDLARLAADDQGAPPFSAALRELTALYPERADCDVAWLYVNSDGSYSAMCGNGLRCLTLFVRQLGWLATDSFKVSTSAYPVVVTIKKRGSAQCTAPGGEPVGLPDDKDAIEVVSRLVGPKFAPQDIPLDASAMAPDQTSFVDQFIEVKGSKFQATCVSMGNPHCVIFEQESLSLDRYAADIKEAHAGGRALQNFPRELLLLAADIQQLSLFPEGVNVEFVKVDKKSESTAIVFVVERGCGATLACASGAAAVLAAGVISGRLNKKSYVILPGGKLEVSLSSVNERESMREYIDLTGPAINVFSGDVTLPLSALLAEMPCDSAAKSLGSSARFGEGLKV